MKRFKIYCKGTECKIPGKTLSLPDTCCSILEGGSINLMDNEVLNINALLARDGVILSLDSGNYLWATYIAGENGFSTMFDWFDGDMGFIYAPGSIMKIYTIGQEDIYDIYYDWGQWSERTFADYPCSVIKCNSGNLLHGNWALTTNPKYVGTKVILSNGTEIYVRGPSWLDGEVGVFFTVDSGIATYSYYNRNDVNIQESCSGYFGYEVSQGASTTDDILQDGDKIIIYDTDNQYDVFLDLDFDEGTISQYCTKLCILEFWDSDNMWHILYDGTRNTSTHSSCSVATGGTLILSDDSLVINERMGEIERGWGDIVYGIEFDLTSGSETISFMHLPNGGVFETVRGMFYDFSDIGETEQSVYAEGTYINIYNIGSADYQSVCSHWINPATDEAYISRQGFPVYKIEIQDNRWNVV